MNSDPIACAECADFVQGRGSKMALGRCMSKPHDGHAGPAFQAAHVPVIPPSFGGESHQKQQGSRMRSLLGVQIVSEQGSL